jgi:hypothetical protein
VFRAAHRTGLHVRRRPEGPGRSFQPRLADGGASLEPARSRIRRRACASRFHEGSGGHMASCLPQNRSDWGRSSRSLY